MAEDIAPFLVAIIMFGLVPVVYMLLKHQQKMAGILHDRREPLPNHQTTDRYSFKSLSRLRDVITQQSIALDNLASSQKSLETRLAESDELRQRIQS